MSLVLLPEEHSATGAWPPSICPGGGFQEVLSVVGLFVGPRVSLVGLVPVLWEVLRHLLVPGVALLGSGLFLEAEHVPCPEHLLLWCPQAHPAPTPCPSFHPNVLLNPSGGSGCLSVHPWQGLWGLVVRGLCWVVTGHADCPQHSHCWPEGRLGTVPLCWLQHGDTGMWEQ